MPMCDEPPISIRYGDFFFFFFFFFFFNRVYSDKTNTTTFTGLSYIDTHTHTKYIVPLLYILWFRTINTNKKKRKKKDAVP